MAEKRLDIKITGDNSGFAKAANSTVGMLNRIGGMAKLFAGGFIASQIAGSVRWAGQINDAASRLGVSAESLQVFQRAAAQSGVTLENLTMSLQNMQRAQEDAISSGNAGSFADIGITMDELRTMNPEQLFMRMSRAIEKAGAGSRSLSAALQIMGKGGGPMLASMRDGFAGLTEEIKNLNQHLNKLELEKLDRLDDRLTDLGIRAKQAAGRFTLWANDFLGQVLSGGAYLAGKYLAGLSQEEIDASQRSIFDYFGIVKDVKPKGYVPPDKPSQNFVNPLFQSKKSAYDLAIANDAVKAESAGVSIPTADTLARVGGFTGGPNMTIVRKLDESARLLKGIERQLVQLNRTVEEE
jgi:hypothetical protein